MWGEDTHADRQQGDIISIVLFFSQSKLINIHVYSRKELLMDVKTGLELSLFN
jgi:hypothetical protein